MQSASTAQYYNFNHERMGVAFIINQITGRKGAELDGSRIRNILEEFGFEVITKSDDLTLPEIYIQLQELVEKDFSKYNCFLMVIMTHGADDGKKLTAAEGFTYDVEDIYQYFYPAKCPTLAGKPKFFFIQTCRGKGTDEGYVLEEGYHADDGMANATQRIPVTADVLTMFASDKGKLALRPEDKGSWFIQTLCEELEAAKNNNGCLLFDLLLKVQRRIATEKYSEKTDQRGPTCQMPSIVSTLTKHCFLAPRK